VEPYRQLSPESALNGNAALACAAADVVRRQLTTTRAVTAASRSLFIACSLQRVRDSDGGNRHACGQKNDDRTVHGNINARQWAALKTSGDDDVLPVTQATCSVEAR
jgi:hypothetical protein